MCVLRTGDRRAGRCCLLFGWVACCLFVFKAVKQEMQIAIASYGSGID
jgi:hypothetical protein